MSPKIDANDTNNSLACTEYVKDIFAHYKSIESKYLPDPTYMSRHPNFNDQTRLLTINWLMTIHGYYEFSPETMYLCVNIFDRFLSSHPDMALDKIHLVAITSLFIASKYEEIKPLNTSHLIKMTRKAYTKEDILIMERLILKTLDFNLTIASVYVFLKRYLKCSGNFDNVQVQIATFVAEMSLYDTAMLNYTPSTIACAAIYVARSLRKCGGDKWNSNLVYYSGKTEDDILPCAKQVYYFMKCFCSTPTFESGRKTADKNYLLVKFSKPEHLKISESIKQVFEQKKRGREQQ
ncbi:cyclin-like protein [Naegleria gruberi]|uniref:Cyclin-like protein n=1 Tax=Naegleria gruberi TaxID=5762 RepID=D2V4R5_NAEGR|nr:cyclin-like protein [Naegleria gruberi]EFC48147.1 cyclin-like protein [Naegleria gruberi]|eukprot:XP_002680891.1 cyclin-like protein [Naegleria gruberi strain NEG-M]